MNLRSWLAQRIDPSRAPAWPFPTVRRATLAEIAASRLGSDASDTASWAPTAYGHYYAQSVPVYSAVKLRALAAAEAPIQVVRRDADGDFEPVPEQDPLQQLFMRMNPFWTQADVVIATQVYRLLWGSAFWFVEKSGSTPIGIWPLRPDRVRVMAGKSPRPGGENYIIGYKYSGGAGREIPLLPEEVVWFREFNPLDEFAGLSPIAPARLQLDAGKDATLYNRLFFSNGAHPDLVFYTNDPVSDEERENFLRAVDKRYKGTEKAHTAMLWSTTVGPKPERLGLTQVEMQFLDGLRWTVEDASRVFEVPREMLGVGDVTFANRELAERHFYRAVVSRDWQFLATEINEMLMPVLGASEDLSVRFDASAVRALHDAMVAREDGLINQLREGIITINEFREEQGRDAVPWGDRPFLPLTLVQIGEDGSAPDVTDQEAAYSAYGEAHVKGLKQREMRFETVQRKLFGEQEESVLAAVGREESRQIGVFVQKQVPPFERLFDPTEWIRAFTARGKPLIAAAISQAAREGANAFKLPPFDANDPQVQRWLDDRVDFWATRVNTETGRLLRSEIEDAAKNGEGIFEVRERVRKIFAFSREFRAERVARTEMLAASSKGHVEVYRQSGVVEGKRWVTTVDDRTRPTHLAANGQVVGLEDKFQVGGSLMEAPGLGDDPAEVVNCFLPGTEISGEIVAGLKAWYAGPAWEIETLGGKRLRVTANHPIMTAQGWRRAHELREGDRLLTCRLDGQFSMQWHVNHQHRPASVEDLFQTLAANRTAGLAMIGALDLDGDGRFVHGHIQIVRTEGLLLGDGEPCRFQGVGDGRLVTARAVVSAAHGDRAPLLRNGAVDLPPTGLMGGGELAVDSFRVRPHDLPFDELRVGPAANWHAQVSEQARQGRSADPDFLGQLLQTGAGQITLDEIVRVGELHFVGHVYDFQSPHGWLMADGIIASNCRCAAVPVVRRARALPAPSNGLHPVRQTA